MSAIGRPRALTSVKRAELCSLVSSGIELNEAVGYVGCSTRTVRRETERNDDFRRMLTQAQLASRLDPVFFLRKAAQRDWRAAAWLLERTDPDQFRSRDRATCSPEELKIVVDRVLEAALSQIDQQEARTRVYRHATSVARAAINELFPAATPSGPRLRRHFYPHCEHEAADEMLTAHEDLFDAMPLPPPRSEQIPQRKEPQPPADNSFWPAHPGGPRPVPKPRRPRTIPPTRGTIPPLLWPKLRRRFAPRPRRNSAMHLR